MPKNATLDLQERCARQAREEFNLEKWGKEESAELTSHYSVALNKCFMLTTWVDIPKTPKGAYGVHRALRDAFERKTYGDYGEHSDKGHIFLCEVKTLSGGTKTCASSDEFDVLVKPYME